MTQTTNSTPNKFCHQASRFLYKGQSRWHRSNEFGQEAVQWSIASIGARKAIRNAESDASGKPMSIFCGSNSGTCEGRLQALAGAAASHVYRAIVKPPDSRV